MPIDARCVRQMALPRGMCCVRQVARVVCAKWSVHRSVSARGAARALGLTRLAVHATVRRLPGASGVTTASRAPL
jgi:hypothetical protein